MSDSNETESPTETKKPTKEKEVLVVHDQGVFVHQTGDTYDGYFEAKKKDRSVKMNGPGIYTTAEGDVYSCTWENDKISNTEEVAIGFADGSRYEGYIKDWCYTGPAKYFYPDDSFIQCTFAENCPVGDMLLNDPNGHVWLGQAQQGFAWFEPQNHYYMALEKMRRESVRRRESTRSSRKSAAMSPSMPFAVGYVPPGVRQSMKVTLRKSERYSTNGLEKLRRNRNDVLT